MDEPEGKAIGEIKVSEGKDGYLFLANDTNRVIDQVEGSWRLPDRQIWATAMVHAARRALCEAVGARYDHVVVPDRETILTDCLPDGVRPGRNGPRPLGQYLAAGAARVHAPIFTPEALGHAAPNPYLFRRDTHWTWQGARRYLEAVLPRLDLDPAVLDSVSWRTVEYRNPGDLGVKIGAPPEPASFEIPEQPAWHWLYDNELPNVGRLRVIRNDARPQGERLLVLHDSFGEWLTLALPLWAHTTCFVHTPDFDEMFTLDFAPTRVIQIQIERFFVRQPLNGVDLTALIAAEMQRKLGRSWEGLPEGVAEALRAGRAVPARTTSVGVAAVS